MIFRHQKRSLVIFHFLGGTLLTVYIIPHLRIRLITHSSAVFNISVFGIKREDGFPVNSRILKSVMDS